MGAAPFRLRPFAVPPDGPGFSVGGSIARRAETLSVRYELRGELSRLAIPPPAAAPRRQDRLWELTCFELFVAARGAAAYWEINISPAGHWNVYRFAGYRQGMRPEPAIDALRADIRAGFARFGISLRFPLRNIFPAGTPVDIGISAVIMHKTGESSYWALAHPGGRPDFHQRDCFIMSL